MNNHPQEFIEITECLQKAWNRACDWQARVHAEEGDSELFRKLSMYLQPNLKHWIDGAQCGNVMDLTKYYERQPKKIDNTTNKV